MFCNLILKLQLLQITSLIQNKKKMFIVSYVLIVSFRQVLNLNRIIIERSYLHSLEELTTVKYFNDDQMKFIDSQTLK